MSLRSVLDVPINTYISLGTYVKTYGEWEDFSGPSSYDTSKYEYSYTFSRAAFEWPYRQLPYVIDRVEEISNRQPITLQYTNSAAELGWSVKEKETTLKVEAERDINAILWWGEDGVLLGTFPYFVDWRDVKDGTWTIQTIRLGLFEVCM